ncbi:MAG: DUF3302 domain-containing protein [Proteobacteria bacterium]|nr:DUF3302 domain-containing protein [Pseudomonadota bacterium]
MSGLDIFAWIVLIVMIATVLIGFIALAKLPGKIALDRGHPQAEAVNVAGWLGALALGVFWPLAMVWAFTHSPEPTDVTAEPADKETAK